ncbi:MAG TPA: hypothetical protein VN764_09055 [Polyangiaceae bacterium]|nr:hypothetical protein [Polyangiaceae bacterium]
MSVLSCSPVTPVLRKRGATTELGRAIAPEAYAYFMRGLRAESAQATGEARGLFLAALRADPQGGAVWAGLLRTACDLPPKEVDDILSAAVRSSDRPALPLVAYAQCKLQKASAQSTAAHDAERASRQALQFEPLFRQASWTLQASLDAQGRAAEARRVRDGYELYTGQRFNLKVDEAERLPTLSAIDRELLRGDIARAQDTASGRLTLGELSTRAWALGRAPIALKMAQAVLINEPDQPDARLILMLSHRPLQLEQLTHLLNSPRTDLSVLGLVFLAIELRGIQPDASRHLLDEVAAAEPSKDDPLLESWLREARR